MASSPPASPAAAPSPEAPLAARTRSRVSLADRDDAELDRELGEYLDRLKGDSNSGAQESETQRKNRLARKKKKAMAVERAGMRQDERRQLETLIQKAGAALEQLPNAGTMRLASKLRKSNDVNAKLKKQRRSMTRRWQDGEAAPEFEPQGRYVKTAAKRGTTRRHRTYSRKAQKPRDQPRAGARGDYRGRDAAFGGGGASGASTRTRQTDAAGGRKRGRDADGGGCGKGDAKRGRGSGSGRR
jgi:hypothetical protein